MEAQRWEGLSETEMGTVKGGSCTLKLSILSQSLYFFSRPQSIPSPLSFPYLFPLLIPHWQPPWAPLVPLAL